MWDALIRAKFVYGLESTQNNPDQATRLDAFDYKGLRQILKLEPTFRNRNNSNAAVLQAANLRGGYISNTGQAIRDGKVIKPVHRRARSIRIKLEVQNKQSIKKTRQD